MCEKREDERWEIRPCAVQPESSSIKRPSKDEGLIVCETVVHRGDHDEVVDDDGDADMLMMSVVICS